MIKIKKHNTIWMFQFDLLWYVMNMFGGVGSKAMALKHFVFIHSQEEDNKPLIAHEKDHMRDQKKTGFWRWVRKYRRDKVFRFQVELRAHAIEYLHGGDLDKVASSFHDNYDLKFVNSREPEDLILKKSRQIMATEEVEIF